MKKEQSPLSLVDLGHPWRVLKITIHLYNHGTTASSKSAMRILQESSQPWNDELINVVRVGLTSIILTMARLPHQSCRVDLKNIFTTMDRPPHQRRP
jgi:hypothetical protein